MKLSTIAFRNLGRNRRRTILSISTLVIACMMGLFMLSLVTGMKADMKRNILSYFTGTIRIRHNDFDKYDYLNPVHLYVRDESVIRTDLRQIEGVTAAVARVTTGGKLFVDKNPDDDIPGEQLSGVALGLDFSGEKDVLAPESLLVAGRLPREGRQEAAVGAALAGQANIKPGDEFTFLTLTAGRAANAMTFTVTGLLKFPMGGMGRTHFLVPLDRMQYFLRMPDGAHEILVMTGDPENALPQERMVKEYLSSRDEYSNLGTQYWKRYGQFYPMLGIAELMYNFIVMFFLILGATVIINTTMMVVYERYREIGILGALGMKPKEVVKLFALEAFIAGVISAVIGLILGISLVLALEQTGLNFGSVYDNMNMEISSVIHPKLKLYHVVLMGIYTVVITSLVTLIPSRQAASIGPDQALRSD